MNTDREAALRNMLTAILGLLDLPIAAASGPDRPDQDLLWRRAAFLGGALRQLTSGPIDDNAIRSFPGTVAACAEAYPVTYTPALPPRARDGDDICGALGDGEHTGLICTAKHARPPLIHVAYGQDGDVVATWLARSGGAQ